jgi:RsmE family RNA methyltransferase
MNILLLNPDDLNPSGTIVLRGAKLEHLNNVLKVTPGKIINVGLKNTWLDQAIVEAINSEFVQLRLLGTQQVPPATLPCSLILGLPRPRMLQRSLQTIATMGVEKLFLIASERVEKSFWQTPLLKPAAIQEQLEIGLEQAKATQVPEIILCQNWREFANHLMPTLNGQYLNKIIAHPGDAPSATTLAHGQSLVAVGPEGGFVESEVAFFKDQGFSQVQLGERILRVETAIPVLLAKLF